MQFLHSLGDFVLVVIWCALGTAVSHMMRHGDPAAQFPFWGPVGNVPYRSWVREVCAWLNVISGRVTPQQQAWAL